jgi:transposase-like protein
MGAKRRQFTAEFKLEAVRLASESEKPLTQVARECGSALICYARGSDRRRAERA